MYSSKHTALAYTQNIVKYDQPGDKPEWGGGMIGLPTKFQGKETKAKRGRQDPKGLTKTGQALGGASLTDHCRVNFGGGTQLNRNSGSM